MTGLFLCSSVLPIPHNVWLLVCHTCCCIAEGSSNIGGRYVSFYFEAWLGPCVQTALARPNLARSKMHIRMGLHTAGFCGQSQGLVSCIRPKPQVPTPFTPSRCYSPKARINLMPHEVCACLGQRACRHLGLGCCGHPPLPLDALGVHRGQASVSLEPSCVELERQLPWFRSRK